MTINPVRIAVAAVLVVAGLQTCPLLSPRLLAHHSFSAEFDENKPVKVTGKVTMMRWSNPHAWIYVDVAGADGKVVNWAFETSAVNSLYRQGWRKEDLPGRHGPRHRRLAGAQQHSDRQRLQHHVSRRETSVRRIARGRRRHAERASRRQVVTDVGGTFRWPDQGRRG
jgi:hypothetical protein